MQGPDHDGHWLRAGGEHHEQLPQVHVHWSTIITINTFHKRLWSSLTRPQAPMRAYARIPIRSPSYISSCSEFMVRRRYSRPGLRVQGGARACIYTPRQRNQAQAVWIRTRNRHMRFPKNSAQSHAEDSNSVTLGGQANIWDSHSRHDPPSAHGSQFWQGGPNSATCFNGQEGRRNWPFDPTWRW
jgi:hypothetical protein